MGLKSITGCHDNRDMAVPQLNLNAGHSEMTNAAASYTKHLSNRKHPGIIHATCTDGRQLPRKQFQQDDTKVTMYGDFTPLKQKVSLNNLATADSLSESLELRSLLCDSILSSREPTMRAESEKLSEYQKQDVTGVVESIAECRRCLGENFDKENHLTTKAVEKDEDETGWLEETKNHLENNSDRLGKLGIKEKIRIENQASAKSKRKNRRPKREVPDKLKLFTENCLTEVNRAVKSGKSEEGMMEPVEIVEKMGKDLQMENLKEMSYQYVELPMKKGKQNDFSEKCDDEKFEKQKQNEVSEDDITENWKKAPVFNNLEQVEMPGKMVMPGSVEPTNTAADDDDEETGDASRLLLKIEAKKRRVALMEEERERKQLALIHAALTATNKVDFKEEKNMFNIQLVSDPETKLHSIEDNRLLDERLQTQDSEQTSLKLRNDPLNQKEGTSFRCLPAEIFDANNQPTRTKVFYGDKKVNDFSVQMNPIMGELESAEPLEPVENTFFFARCTHYTSLHSLGRDVFMSCMDKVKGQGQMEGQVWDKSDGDGERDSSLKKAIHHQIQDHMLHLKHGDDDDENDNELKYSPEEKPVIEPEDELAADSAVANDDSWDITHADTPVEGKEAEAIEHEDVSGFPEENSLDETEVDAQPEVIDNVEPGDVTAESEHFVEAEADYVEEIHEKLEMNDGQYIDDLIDVIVGVVESSDKTSVIEGSMIESTDIGTPDENDVTDAKNRSSKKEILFEKDASGPEKSLHRKPKKNIHKVKDRKDKRGLYITDKDELAEDGKGADENGGNGGAVFEDMAKDEATSLTVKVNKKGKGCRKRDEKELSEVHLESPKTWLPSKDTNKGWKVVSRRRRLTTRSKPNKQGDDLLPVRVSWGEGPFDVSQSKRRNRSSPLSNLGRWSSGRRCSNHGSSGRNGTQGSSGSRSGGHDKPSDNSKDNNNRGNHPNRENNEDKDRGNNSPGHIPSQTPTAADVPEFDPKGPRKKHSEMSDNESFLFLGKLTQELEAPMFEIPIDRVHYCLLRCLFNPEFESADMISCCFCNIVNSLLKHYADCQAVYNDCKMCVQIFSLICAHVNSCMKTEPCYGRLCTVILQHLAGESVAAHIRTLWFRIRKKLARLIGGTDTIVEPLREPASRISTRSSRTHSIGLQQTLPSIPETGPASHTSSNSGSRVLLRKVSNLPDVSENISNNAPDSVDNARMRLSTTGELPSLMMMDAVPRHRNSTGIHSLPMGPPAWPEPSYPSFKEHPTGTKGIGEVVVSNKKQLKKVAQMWDTPKRCYLAEGRLAHHYSEEGIILKEYEDKLVVAGIRYGLDFQWVKVSHLGNGMSGKCSLAKDFTTEFLFCVKEIHISNYELQEIELWLDLDHPHIVKMYGAIRHAEKIYIFMEFVEGGCLTEVINQQKLLNQRLSQHTALLYFKQILEVLIYLKNKQILHEDIKADNLLLHKKNNSIAIKMTDFGLARRCQKLVPKNTKPIGTQTQWSPQKAQGVQYGFCAEVWAATCVFIHMLTGQPPWIKRYGQQANKTLIFVIVEKSPPIEDIPHNIDGAIKDLVELALARERDQRPTAEQLLRHRAFSLLEEDPSTNKFSILESGVKMSTQLDSKDNSDLIDIVKGLTANSTLQSKPIHADVTDRTSFPLAGQGHSIVDEGRGDQAEVTSTAGQGNPAEMFGRDQQFPSDIIAYPVFPEMNLDPTNHLLNFLNDPVMGLGPVGLGRPNNLTLYEPEKTGEMNDVQSEAENLSIGEGLPRFEKLYSTLSGGDTLEGLGYMSSGEEDEEKEDLFKEFVLADAIAQLKQSGSVLDEESSKPVEGTRNGAVPIIPSNIPNVLEMVPSRSTSFHQSDDAQLSKSGLENENKASDGSLPVKHGRELNLASWSKHSRQLEAVTDAENEDYLFMSGPDESTLIHQDSKQAKSSNVTIMVPADDSPSTFSPVGPTSSGNVYTPPSNVPLIVRNFSSPVFTSTTANRMSHSQSSPSFVTSPMPVSTSSGYSVGQWQPPGSQHQFTGSKQQFTGSPHQFPGSQDLFTQSNQLNAGSHRHFHGSQQQSTVSQRQFHGLPVQSHGLQHQYTTSQQQSPGLKHQYTASEQPSPGSKHQYPNSQQKSPGSQQQIPGSQQQRTGSHHHYPASLQQSPGSQHQYLGSQQQSTGSHHHYPASLQQSPGSQHQGSQKQSPGSQHQFLGSQEQIGLSLQYQQAQHMPRVLSYEPIIRSPYLSPARKEAQSLSPYPQTAPAASPVPTKDFFPNEGVPPVGQTGPSPPKVASADMTRSKIPARHIQKADINAKNESKRFEYMSVTINPRPPQPGTVPPNNNLHIDVTKAQGVTSHTQQQVLQTAPILSPPKPVTYNRGTSLTTTNQRKSTSSQSSDPLSTGSTSKSQFEAQEDALKLLGKTAEDALSEHSDHHMMNFHKQLMDPEDEVIGHEFEDINIENPAESLAYLLDSVEDEHITVVFLNKCDGSQFKMRFSPTYKEKTWCEILEQEDVIMRMIHDEYKVTRFHLQLEDGSDIDLDSKLGASSLTVHISTAPTSAHWWVEKGMLMRA